MWEVSQSEGSSHGNQASVVLIDGSKCHHGDDLLHTVNNTVIARSVAVHGIQKVYNSTSHVFTCTDHPRNKSGGY